MRLAALALAVASGCTCLVYMPPDAGAPDSGSAGGTAGGSGTAGGGTAGGGSTGGGVGGGAPHDGGMLPDAGVLRCVGVACVGDTTCSLDDGVCRCNGVTCQSGQTCTCPLGMPGCQPTERVCATSTRCDGVTCGAGITCDPADGLCKCDGPGGATCSGAQLCGAIRPPQCQGGCASLCDRGLSCDETDQTCKCGGHQGLDCAADEICVSVTAQFACRFSCAVGAECPAGQACFIDTEPALDVAYCAFPSGLLGEGEQCTRATQCFDGHALHCAGLSAQVPVGTCREACDPSAAHCAVGRHCVGLADVRDGGFCVP